MLTFFISLPEEYSGFVRMYKYDKWAKTRGMSERATITCSVQHTHSRDDFNRRHPVGVGHGQSIHLLTTEAKSGPNQMKYVKSHFGVLR